MSRKGNTGVNKAGRRLRIFAVRLSYREIFIFLCCLAFSVACWLVLVMSETYEYDIRVPMVVTGVPSNVSISDSNQTITVTVRDKGYSIALLALSQPSAGTSPDAPADTTNAHVCVSFSQYFDNSGRSVVPVSDVIRHLQPYLSPSGKVTAVKPEKIEFFYTNDTPKKVPVRIAGAVVPAAGYAISSARVTPDSVTVFADKNKLATITEVFTGDVSMITDVSSKVTRTVDLRKIQGVRIKPSRVTLTVVPDLLIQGKAEVQLTTTGVPSDRAMQLFPKTVNVTYSVGNHQYNRTATEAAKDFRIEVNYADLAANPELRELPVHLTATPKGVTNVHIYPQKVAVVIDETGSSKGDKSSEQQ